MGATSTEPVQGGPVTGAIAVTEPCLEASALGAAMTAPTVTAMTRIVNRKWAGTTTKSASGTEEDRQRGWAHKRGGGAGIASVVHHAGA